MSIPANLPVAKDARYWLKMQTHASIFAVHVYYRILSYKLYYIVIHCYTEYYITIIISYYITLYYTRMLF